MGGNYPSSHHHSPRSRSSIHLLAPLRLTLSLCLSLLLAPPEGISALSPSRLPSAGTSLRPPSTRAAFSMLRHLGGCTNRSWAKKTIGEPYRSLVGGRAMTSKLSPSAGDGDGNRVVPAIDSLADLSNLSRAVAKALIDSHPKPRAVLAIAGGGSPALSALTATPGASSVLLEGTVCYDRRSFAGYVGMHPLSPPPQVWAPAPTPTGRAFSFSGSEAATILSNASLHRAMELTPTLMGMLDCVGVGCASALSIPSRPDKPGAAHVVVTGSDGQVVSVDATLSAGGSDLERRRDRAEEDAVVGSIVLTALARHGDEVGGAAGKGWTLTAAEMDSILGREGDSASQSRGRIGPSTAKEAAVCVVSGQADAVILVPDPEDGCGNGGVRPLVHPVLPPDPLIFPGSFNPPHIGHRALAEAAVQALMRIRAEEKGEGSESFSAASTHGSVWDAAEAPLSTEFPSLLFETSLTNVDKPPMDPSEAARRVGLFRGCIDGPSGVGSGIGNDADDSPLKDWGVLLTSAPLFSQKVEILANLVSISSSAVAERTHGKSSAAGTRRRLLTFVIGTDTMVRIINPKYYGDSYDAMLSAVRDMGAAGVRFIVGGRLDQGEGNGRKIPSFISGKDDLASLPKDVQGMFTLLTESDFRLDISSTDLRAAAGSRIKPVPPDRLGS